MSQSWGADVFDRIYARDVDPWHVETSDYERAKYAATLAALPHPRFSSALEVGCSIGVQTAQLAQRCDRLLSLDLAAEAVRRTRERCVDLPNVVVRQACVPRDWPDGKYDLIVFSEVLYFLSPADIQATVQQACNALKPAGAILLVNWTGETDTPTTGEAAARLFARDCEHRLEHVLAQPAESYRIDVFRRPVVQDSKLGAGLGASATPSTIGAGSTLGAG